MSDQKSEKGKHTGKDKDKGKKSATAIISYDDPEKALASVLFVFDGLIGV